MTKSSFDHGEIEKAAQEKWEKLKLHETDLEKAKDPYYLLFEFPYPSGDIHIGHWYAYALTDIFARYMRAKGKDVLFPIGFDAFGLPAENAAMRHGADPKKWTYANMERMRAQIRSMGTSVDWSKEVVTCEPDYYRWTQWLFLKLYENGFAERREAPVKWCPKDATVLANEQVVDGRCERCGTEVEEKRLTQWFLKITKYAEQLLAGLDTLPWREDIKEAQRAWIGKSEGAKLWFPLSHTGITRVLLLHGKGGTSEESFFPWLTAELTKRGYEVEAPDLPNSREPDADEQADFVEKNCSIDENTIVIGKSFGGDVALRLLERGTRMRQLITAGTPVSGTFVDGKTRPTVTATCAKGFDWKSIKKNCGSFVVLFDIRDAVVPQEDGDMLAKGLGVSVTRVRTQDTHFSGSTEPSILDALCPSIEVFTTRPDTVFGATYVVLAPEHPLVATLSADVANMKEVRAYIHATKKKTERERQENKEKTGVKLEGVMAVNPATKEVIPVYLADYVLASYGTGAVMAVPAHDERDFEFATKFDLPIRSVIEPLFPGRSDTDRVRLDKPMVERDAVAALVKHWRDDTYLVLKWKKVAWYTFITGGIEKGQTPEEAIREEIRQETGYTHPKLVRELGTFHSKFFHTPKDENRFGHFRAFHFTLEDDAREPISEDEQGKHEPLWLSLAEAQKVLTADSHFYLIDRLAGDAAFTGSGILANSGEFSGRENEEVMWDIVTAVDGERTTNYRIRDWLVSRQRYWGCPIPIAYDPDGKPHPVPEEHLPWLLPSDVDFASGTEGKAPLASSAELHARVEKIFGKGWTPEYDTLDTFVDSSWYYLRYLAPHDEDRFSDSKLMKEWIPVDRYSGGSEHTTMHLLYARFFHKALHDLDLAPGEEPFVERYNRGLILGPDGAKMSKSKGNVINPDEYVGKYGADAVRMYLAFMGPYNEPGQYPWQLEGVAAMRKFLERVARLREKSGDASPAPAQENALRKAIEKCGEDIERFKFNTAISSLMILVNEMEAWSSVPKSAYHALVRALAPLAPHLSEHLWEATSGEGSVHARPWPSLDGLANTESADIIGVQVGGKRRGEITLDKGATEEEAVAAALAIPAVRAALPSGKPSRVVYVPGKVLNLVC